MISRVDLLFSGPYTPEYATEGAAGFDLRFWHPASEGPVSVAPQSTMVVSTGLFFEVPYGYEVQIRPRSGLAKDGLVAQFGTIDSDYRGVIKVILHNNTPWTKWITHNDRIAQGILAPVVRAVFVQGEVTEDTARGSGGFGSTGV